MCLSRTGKRWISVVVSKWSVFQNTVTFSFYYCLFSVDNTGLVFYKVFCDGVSFICIVFVCACVFFCVC